MVRPNVPCSYLLQIRPLEDAHGEHWRSRETAFPDYERFLHGPGNPSPLAPDRQILNTYCYFATT
jgi:hypothetical protein